MENKNQINSEISELQDIRRMMNRSSRFISLSGLSGVFAGVCALVGSYIAHLYLKIYYVDYNNRGEYAPDEFGELRNKLFLLALIIFIVACSLAFLFTWRKAKQNNLPVWDYTAKRMVWNLIVPLAAGGAFCLGMLCYNIWIFVAPACLVFYGLGLINAGKYTLSDIRYLGYCQIVVGLINLAIVHYSLYFWAFGFGVLHIIYGVIMWWKYDKNPSN